MSSCSPPLASVVVRSFCVDGTVNSYVELCSAGESNHQLWRKRVMPTAESTHA